MKCKKLLIAPFLVLPVLAACGGEKVPTDNSIYVTFKAEGQEDVKVKITGEMDEDSFEASIPEIVYPENKPEGWYDGYWDDIPSFEDITESITVNAVFDEMTFRAFFKNEDVIVKTVNFTYEDYKADPNHQLNASVIPQVPTKDWYDGTWASYVLEPSNIVIQAQYTYHTYVAKFVDENGSLVEEVNFTKEDYDANENHVLSNEKTPQIPDKTGMEGEWNEYSLTNEDITIGVTYTLHKYYIDFYDGEGEDANLVDSTFYFMNTESIEDVENIPSLDSYKVEGYEVSWDLPESLTYSDTHMRVNLKYTAKEYQVSYSDGTSQTVTYGQPYELKNAGTSTIDGMSYTWTYANRPFAQTGTWNVAKNITLDKSVPTINFEGNAIPNVFTITSRLTPSIETENVIEGNQALKLTIKSVSDNDITLSREALDTFFADENVKYMQFMVYSSISSNNFRYKDATGANRCYETNHDQFGLIAGQWKVFRFTREMYNAWGDTLRAFVVWGSNGKTNIGDYIIIDDIRAGYTDVYKTLDFENTDFYKEENGVYIYNDGVYCDTSAPDNNKKLNFRCQYIAGDELSVNQDVRYTSEGYSSMHLATTTKGYRAFWLRPDILAHMNDNDVFMIDILLIGEQIELVPTDFCYGVTVTGEDGKRYNPSIESVEEVIIDQWMTISIPKNMISSDGRFLILATGKMVGDLYIDNGRVATVA